MNTADLVAIAPLIGVGATAIVVMVAIAFFRSHRTAVLLATLGQIASFAVIPFGTQLRQITPLLVMDPYGSFLMALLIGSSFVVTVLSFGYLRRRQAEPEEFYVLLLLATLGSLVLVCSSHFVSLFIGLEILSVSLYAMIAYLNTERLSIEAGLKYLILAGASSAFLVFGMALVYCQTGTMEFSKIGASGSESGWLLVPGFALIVSGLGFKLALVPFHMWTPDVYEGAPAPVTAFVATASKGSVFALLLRYFMDANGYATHSMVLALAGISIASMVFGNLLALMQCNVKRILAYSSIAHLGYLFVAFLAGRDLAVQASTFYLVAYFVSILAAFGVISVLSSGERDLDDIESYRGLFWRKPWVAAVFTAALFSLAGIPLTAGFVGKFYILAAGVDAARWLLVMVLIVTSAVGLFYYLRVIVALYSPVVPPRGEPAAEPTIAWTGGLVLAGLMVLLLWLGVYPSSILRLLQHTTL